MELILTGVSIVLAAAAGWLAWGRGRLLAQAAAARAERDAAVAESDRLRRQNQEQEASAKTLTEDCAALDKQLAALQEKYDALSKARETEVENLQSRHREHLRVVEDRERQLREHFERRDAEMREHFKALAADALKGSSESFLKLAAETMRAEHERGAAELEKRRAAVDELVKPIAETLKETRTRLDGLAATSGELKDETVRLARALSKPEVRGAYGEIQLRRVAELAGMRAYCDFDEQASQRDDQGRLLRPDMIVRLPNDRMIVVDAKANLQAFLEAAGAKTPEEAELCFDRFARHVDEQVTALSKKQYWAEFDGSPEFVVMFVPGDQYVDAALSRRADLIERAAQQNVILASPSTLIGLLRAVAVGWREKRLDEQAKELFELGKQLHERAVAAMTHVVSLGKAIQQAAQRYNDMAGSLESRLMPTLRRFEESGARSAKELPGLVEVDVRVRALGQDAPGEANEG